MLTPFKLILPALLCVAWMSVHVAQLNAQGRPQPLPKQEYYLHFDNFYQGDYTTVGKRMLSFSSTAMTDSGGKFLDSVCYWTILGENYYRLGNYSQALEQYEAALDLYLSLQAWTTRTTFPTNIEVDQSATRRAAQVPWASSSRTPSYGKFNNPMLITLGKSNAENEAVLRRGGVIDPLRLRSVDIAEVMRCVSLALYRRQMIKGPTCALDPYTKTLVSSLIGNGGSTVAGAWTGVAKGIALASQNENARAAQVLRGSLLIDGRDHPLTPIALLALGKVAAAERQYQDAQALFLEASICAVAYEQYDVVEDSIRYATLLHSAGQTRQPYQPLLAAIGWARSANRDTLQASLLIAAAHVAAEGGDIKTAGKALDTARSEMRNDLKKTDLQTQWYYIDAMVNYLDEDVNNGDKQFANFLKASQATSLWLFQIALADNAVKEGIATDRESELLYDALLREPVDSDWLLRPIETMAYLSTPHYEPMERWFEVTLSRKAEEKAIGIAELVRRQRFFSSLPFGGRLLSLRWVLEAPNEALSDNGIKQKAALLQKYSGYKELSDRANALQNQLEAIPVVPDAKTDEEFQQKQLLAEYTDVVIEQEKFLRKIALSREAVELTFPQPLTVPEIQQRLKPKQAIISFLRVGQLYYVMNLSGGRYSIESTIQAKVLDRKILQLLKEISVSEKATVFEPDVFANEEWRATAREISALIFAKSEAQALDAIDEIIFVPDGKAWYLPMELLQSGTTEDSKNLVDRVRIRYAPMVNLAVPDQRTVRRFRRSGIVAFRNFVRDDKTRVAQAATDLQAAIPNIETIDKTFRGPTNLIASTLDQLVVWHDNVDKSRDTFGFAPFQFDHGKPGAGLDAWMELPWRGVDKVILPAVSTAIEGKTRGRADGSELFLSTTALMASGVRTILISRWRVGGQSTLDLSREFAAELGTQSASKAWKRSRELFVDSELDITAESRVRDKVLEQPMKADHPFFWAGYMLFDNGTEIEKETPEPEQIEDDSNTLDGGESDG